MLEELWIPIPGFAGYLVSTFGEIFSLRRNRIMKPGFAKGYFLVTLYKDGVKREYHTVHKLVLLSFVGKEEGQARHLDGNMHNNRIDNLSWGSALQNAADRHKHGTTRKGDNHYRAIHSDEIIREIRRAFDGGERGADIARRFGIHRTRIHEITSRKTWKHVA